jgi:small subunit ribosomal protein S9
MPKKVSKKTTRKKAGAKKKSPARLKQPSPKRISKAKTKKVKQKKEVKKPAVKPARYFEAVGRRKTAVARVRLLTQGDKTFLVNKKPLEVYFPISELRQTVTAPLEKMKYLDKFKISAIVRGGGLQAQAQALSHGIARALVLSNPDFRKRLKKAGYLTRDPRMRERKKFGLKRARRAPQWSKR